MGRIELDIIMEKLAALQGYYKELKELEHISFEEYVHNTLYK
ncbi:hypothetical protein [Phosphitispora fastidiosa]|nr:hypothetical protein [Phosphitispora fastidiosa]MBU7005986.1 hypothetical protein [Phosphitispora fastidiosa]